MEGDIAKEASPFHETTRLISTIIKRLFFPVVIFSQVSGITAIGLVIEWMKSYGGFGWTASKIFNLHPVLLTVGMVYLQGQAILLFRLFRHQPKWILKLCHAIIHASTFVLTIIGLVAVFSFHNWASIPNLYSLHSWAGLGLTICYGLQLSLGFFIYLLPYAALRTRMLYMPLHRSFGLFMFAIAGATAVMGVTEKAIFSSKDCWVNRNCDLADIMNWTGLSVILYVISVTYLVATPEYRRTPLVTD